MNNKIQTGLLLIVLSVLGILGYNAWLWETTPPERSYTDFLTDLHSGDIVSVHLQGGEIRGEDRIGRVFRTYSPDLATLMPQLIAARVTITAEEPPSLFDRLLPLFLLIAILAILRMFFTKG